MTTLARTTDGQYVPAFALGTTQSVAYTGTAGRITNAIGEQIELVRIWTSTDAFIKIGQGAVDATTSDMPITAKVAEYFEVRQGDKVSAIQQSGNGTLYVTELK